MPGDKNLFSSLGHTEFSKERDDEQKMEKLVEKARGILFAKSIEEKIQKEAGETLKEEEILGKGKEILNEEAREEINFIENINNSNFDNMFIKLIIRNDIIINHFIHIFFLPNFHYK